MELKIEYLPVKDLQPYEHNARKHADDDVGAIIASIKEFGFDDPIGIWKDNVIIEGHGRLMAAKELGMETVPCIRLDHLTDEQRRAYALAHNRTAELSDWDFVVRDDELAEIFDIDMTAFGFDALVTEETKEIEEDELPEEVETKCKLGDIWQLGRHRLICGDSTDAEVLKKLIEDEHVVLALTDPPYGIDVVRGGASEQATGRVGGAAPLHFRNNRRSRTTALQGKVGGGSMNTPKNNRISPDAVVPATTYKPIIGDSSTETAQKHYEAVKDISGNQILFGGNYFTDFLPASRCWIVWDKNNTGNFADAELAWTSFDRGVKLYRWTWNGLVRQGDRKAEGVKRVHPTQKPVGMIGNILQDFTKEGDTVLDGFGGSGSTLIACEQLNRKCFICELDPHYCDVIIQRWENLTGKKAVLLNDES